MTGEPEPSEAPRDRPGAIRETVATVALLASFLFGGMAIGLAIALTVGGGSVGAIAIGFFALPLAFGFGMMAWRAILGAWLVAILGRAAWRSRGDEARFREEARASFGGIGAGGPAALPGTWALLGVSILTGAVAAILMALVADGGDRIGAAALILGAAIAYGVLLRRLARSGHLPIPEE